MSVKSYDIRSFGNNALYYINSNTCIVKEDREEEVVISLVTSTNIPSDLRWYAQQSCNFKLEVELKFTKFDHSITLYRD